MTTCKECNAEVEKVCEKCEKCDGCCGCGKEETAADAGKEASTESESEEKTE